MVGSITPLGGMLGSFNSPTTQQNTQAPTAAQFNQYLLDKGLKPNQISSLSTAQKETYLRELTNKMQTETQTQGIYANFGNLGATASSVNGLMNASTTGNPLTGLQNLGFGGNLPNANATAMGAGSFGKVNAQAAAIISQMLFVGAPIDSPGTATLVQKINSNPTWQMTTNPMYQQTLAQIQPQLEIGAKQNALVAWQQQQQLQAKAAEEKAKKAKDDA